MSRTNKVLKARQDWGTFLKKLSMLQKGVGELIGIQVEHKGKMVQIFLRQTCRSVAFSQDLANDESLFYFFGVF